MHMPRPTTDERDEADPTWIDRPLPENLEQALKAVGRGSWSEVYPVEFSVIDAATFEYLPSLAEGFEKINRQQLTSGSVQYTLWAEGIGSLGAVRVRKLDERLTELTFQDPPRPERRPPTQEEQHAVGQITDQHERDRAIIANEKRRRAEQDAHHRWRRAWHAVLVKGFLQRLREERDWIATFPETGGRAAPADTYRRQWRHAEDRWLWEQVNVAGIPLRQVLDEWKQKAAHRGLRAPEETARKIVTKDR
jgi:hypothetical protein